MEARERFGLASHVGFAAYDLVCTLSSKDFVANASIVSGFNSRNAAPYSCLCVISERLEVPLSKSFLPTIYVTFGGNESLAETVCFFSKPSKLPPPISPHRHHQLWMIVTAIFHGFDELGLPFGRA